MRLFRARTSLTAKLSLLVTGAVLLVLAVLGWYFGSFLEESFLDSTQKRMQHGYKRLAFNLRNIEQALREGVAFVRTDQGLIASIELINNYQDKNNYNAFLIDEEKKAIAAQLLSRVKLSFNSDIVLYDRNGELVAFVVQEGAHYAPHFISYDGGKRTLYGRFEEQSEFRPRPFTLPAGITADHAKYYTDAQVYNTSAITWHRLGDNLVIKSHQDLVDPDSGRVIAHIELSNVLDRAYFEHLSQDLDIAVGISFDAAYRGQALPLAEGPEVPAVPIRQSAQEYLGVTSRATRDGPVYFVARLDKLALNAVLNENRRRFLLLLVLVAAVTLVLTRYLIQGGLARPLATLMGQINRIEQRDYATAEPLATGDELEAISGSVNRLATAVREREASLEQSHRELQHLSDHDPLTDLPNRRFFADRLRHAIDLARRQQRQLAVFFLDLDQFKLVNDTLGHDLGDELLVQVAERLRGQVRSADTLARIGGDEFNLLVESPHDLHELEGIIERYLALFHRPFHCRGNEISSTVSIGVSLFPRDGEDSVTLIKHADLAMYKAKDRGRNNFSFFSSELSDRARERAEMTRALREAVTAGDQFELYYQPKIALPGGRVDAVEALIRWHSPDYGLLPPGRFIPLAEETGLIVPIGRWVLQQGCRDFVQLRRDGVRLEHISINLSNVQMRHADMNTEVRQAIARSGIRPEQLELEITESYIATNVDEAIATLKGLRDMGVRLAVDDFGTGYSSMSYLQKLPVTRIKVDKSFVDALPHDRDSVAITRAIISLAKSFELAVTAEGVENEAQLDFLVGEGCDEIQGFHFSKPLSLRNFKAFYRLREGNGNIIPLDSRRGR